MKRILLGSASMLILAALASSLLLSGCFSFRKENNEKTLVQLVDHMKKCGLNVESARPALYEMIMASDGLALRVDGVDIQLFKYDTKIKQQKDKLDKIYENGIIIILGVEFFAKVNGSFLMLNYKGHPDEPKLIEAFNSF